MYYINVDCLNTETSDVERYELTGESYLEAIAVLPKDLIILGSSSEFHV